MNISVRLGLRNGSGQVTGKCHLCRICGWKQVDLYGANVRVLTIDLR